MQCTTRSIGYSKLLQFFRGDLYAALNTLDAEALGKDLVESGATLPTLEQYASQALVVPNQRIGPDFEDLRSCQAQGTAPEGVATCSAAGLYQIQSFVGS